MFKTILAVGLLSIAAIPATAQNSDFPRFEVGGGYSFVRANVKSTDSSVTPAVSGSAGFDLHGGRGEVAVNVNRVFGLVADFGGYKITGLPSGFNAHLVTYMFGPRLTYRGAEKVDFFAQAIFGGVHAGGAGSVSVTPGTGFEFTGSESSFAMAVGGGMDYKATKHVAIRFIQVDYLMTRFKTDINSAGIAMAARQNNVRIGAGLQFRF